MPRTPLWRGEMPEPDIEKALLRDLGWLLNTTSLSPTTDLSRWPNVRRSVLNYGVNVFTGKLLGNADLPQIEASIKKAIELYEPRLKRGSLRVQALTDSVGRKEREIRVRIEGKFVAHHQPVSFAMLVAIDAENGRLEIVE